MNHLVASVVLLLFFNVGCNNTSSEATPAQADADSSTVVSVPVALPETETDSSLQDSVFSDGSIPTTWGNSGISDPEGMIEFIRKFQSWASKDERDSIAANINFPTAKWKTKKEFLKAYPLIFTDKFKSAIAKQNLRQVFRNQHGAMIADGRAWFIQDEEEKFRIIAINPD